MFAPTAYRIRFATAEDADTLSRLAERNSQQPLVGRVLIGQLNGTATGALSLHDGRVIADPSPGTGRLVANLRSRAGAIRAFEATPSLSDRLRAAFASYHDGSNSVPASVSANGASSNGHAPSVSSNGHAASSNGHAPSVWTARELERV